MVKPVSVSIGNRLLRKVRGTTGSHPTVELAAEDPYPKAFHAACYAPMTSMYFDQLGNVRACCQNTGTLYGSIRDQTIREVWESASTGRMRAALQVDDYSEGCGFCQWQVDQGDDGLVFARSFDGFAVAEQSPRWPVQMEFSMTNSCNLQCEMCNGDWSSAIRANREHREPLPAVYGDQFFDELAEFLPHLKSVKILGGEPFLGREPLRLMEMLAELESPPTITVTTNGTQLTPRVERILERLPMNLVVSLDGITKKTYESIRIGADFDEVMKHLERFRRYAALHNTSISLAHCLMKSNFREFGSFLRFAEDHDHHVGLNQVLFPERLSIFQMSPNELRKTIDEMIEGQKDVVSTLRTHRHFWDDQIEALRNRLAVIETGDVRLLSPWDETSVTVSLSEASFIKWLEDSSEELVEWSGVGRSPDRLTISTDGVTKLEFEESGVFASFNLSGSSSIDEVIATLAEPYGGDAAVTHVYSTFVDDILVSDPSGEHDLQIRLMSASTDDGDVVFIAHRYPGLPREPHSQMAAYCGSDRVATITVESDGFISQATGPLALLSLDPENVVGGTTDDLFGELCSTFGAVQLEPGPSGYVCDSILTFVDGAGAQQLGLRSMVDEKPDGSTEIIVGVLQS